MISADYRGRITDLADGCDDVEPAVIRPPGGRIAATAGQPGHYEQNQYNK